MLEVRFIQPDVLYCDGMSSHATSAQVGVSEITQGIGRSHYHIVLESRM